MNEKAEFTRSTGKLGACGEMEFETVIGLEVHAQLKTNSKIFCGCSTKFGQPPNSNTCPVCLGLPGTLPTLNRRVVEFALKLALATDCRINRENVFVRKHYFYPDLPSGYQISQLDLPIAEQGWLELELEGGQRRRIGINRIHMEEDAGKLIHDEWKPRSYVDLNRAGTPLLEIVSEPELGSALEAVAYLRKLHAIVRYLDICDGNMEEGSFRCDANISLRPKGQKKLGTRAELKNMNSFRNVQRALEYEERRQRDLLLEGEKVIQATLLWDADKGMTLPARAKEDAQDYRYFPNPDLLPVVVAEAWIEELRAALPELPTARKNRFIELGLPVDDAETLTADRELADYFEQTLQHYPAPKKLSNWIMTELLRVTKGDEGIAIAACPVTPLNLARLLTMMAEGVISGKIAKTVFAEMMLSGASPDSVLKEKNLVLVSDEDELRQIVRQIIAAQPQQAAQFKAGKTKVMGFFVGQLMKETKGQADPQVANQLFAEELGR